MKNRYILIFILWTVYTNIIGQSNKALLNFEVFQKENQVNLVWTMKAGNTCLGIDIERSVLDGEFERIGTITGICGSPIENVSYQYIDENPVSFAGVSYRLNMGVLGYSNELFFRFVDKSHQTVVISPNPNNGPMTLFFPESVPQDCRVEFFHEDGKLCDVLDFPSVASLFSFSLVFKGEEHGVIYVVVKNKEGRIFASGKFLYLK